MTAAPLAGHDGRYMHVLDGGPFTTVQDVPGRIGFWHVGVPPNGPMDDLSHRLANTVVGNHPHAAALELTNAGPRLRFSAPVTIALGGAPMLMSVDGEPQSPWTPVHVPAGAVVAIGPAAGLGLRATLAVRGGIATEPFLGSRATFTLGRFGGHEGRALVAGDALPIGAEIVGPVAELPPGMPPVLHSAWRIGVLIGPHSTAEFLTAGGMDGLLRAEWVVHFNSARTGVRLIGPRPGWARLDGGDAGLHPSNIHDTGYAIGAVDLTGDMPVILGPDGPSLGGFVCPAVVAASERWKLGQLRPGDTVRLVAWSPAQAADVDRRRAEWLHRATVAVEPVARPVWNAARTGRATVDDAARTGRGTVDDATRAGFGTVDDATRAGFGTVDDAVLARTPAADGTPEITYRRAGDRFLLVEYGPMTLDLELRLRVHSLDAWVAANLVDGLVDATPGVRSLLVQVDGERLTIDRALGALRAAEAELPDVAEQPFTSRIVHLPLSWDDPATRLAIERYMHGVRDDAPWCPWNIEFIRRINGLESVDDVRRIVYDASYLVLGLGDVYLGAPVATPVDPRHRLVTTKYNPARTWTAENSVGIGGAYLCIYGMEGPGGYQFVGRTVQVWNRASRGPHFTEPWLLRQFDQLRWFPVEADELLEMRVAQERGELDIKIEESAFVLRDHQRFLAEHADDIASFRATQQAAFGAERRQWELDGEFSR
jgi:urea carboxylase